MCQISHIDIGTHFVFSAQIFVGRSDWPLGKDYVTLLPSTTFMTPLECRKEKHKTSMRMFNREHFHQESFIQKWDRVKVVCTQPFRKDAQLGLSLLRITTDDELDLSPPSHSVQHSKEDSLIEECEKNAEESNTVTAIQKHFFGKAVTGEQQTEGLQSSLAKIAGTAENGSVEEALWSRNVKLVVAAKAKYKKEPQQNKSPEFQETFVKQNIPFITAVERFLSKLDVQSMDMNNITFADLRCSFEEQKHKKLSKNEKKIFLKKARVFIEETMSSKSDSNEVFVNDQSGIIAEPCDGLLCEENATRGSMETNRLKSSTSDVSLKEKQRFCKKRKMEISESVPSKRKVPADYCQQTVYNPGKTIHGPKEMASDKRNSNCIVTTEYISSYDHRSTAEDGCGGPCLTSTLDLTSHGKGNLPGQVTCPICKGLFGENQIEMHASSCGIEVSSDTDVEDEDTAQSSSDDIGQCPICGCVYPLTQLISHVDFCSSSKHFSTE